MRDLRRVGGWPVGLSYKKKFFFCLFWFLSADPENLNAGG
jgi:hypothetical protein